MRRLLAWATFAALAACVDVTPPSGPAVGSGDATAPPPDGRPSMDAAIPVSDGPSTPDVAPPPDAPDAGPVDLRQPDVAPDLRQPDVAPDTRQPDVAPDTRQPDPVDTRQPDPPDTRQPDVAPDLRQPDPPDTRQPDPPDTRQPDPPAAPAGVQPDWHFDGVLVTWQAAAGAERYTLKRGATASGPFTAVAADLTDTRAVDTTAPTSTTVHYVVEATRSGVAAASAPVAYLRAPNLVQNASFEESSPTQTPPAWLTWFPNTSKTVGNAADYTTDKDGARSGQFHLTITGGASSFAVYSFTQVKDLPAGRYRARAWVRTTNIPSSAYFHTKHCTGMDVIIDRRLSVSAAWTEVTVDFDLSHTLCEVGFWADGPAGTYLDADDIALHLLPPP